MRFRFSLKPKRMVELSLVAAGLVALLSLLDLAAGVPFGRQVMMDVMSGVSAAIVIYLAIGVYREQV